MEILASVLVILAALAFGWALVKEYRTSGMTTLSWLSLGFLALTFLSAVEALRDLF